MGFEPGYHQSLPPDTDSLGPDLLLESGLKVTEQGERPLELMGKEELLASLGLREEGEEREALLQGESTSEGSGEPGTTGEEEDGERRTCASGAWPLCFVGSVSPSPAKMSSRCSGSAQREGPKASPCAKGCWERGS